MDILPSLNQQAEWPPGWRILPNGASIACEVIDAWRTIPVAVAGDCMGRSIGATGLRQYHPDLATVMCGRAVTVRTRPGDNLVIHKAMLMANPGDVIVIDAGGSVEQAIVGGLMRTTAIARKLGGFIVDGAVRDLLEWQEGGMPCFARGHTHRGPSKDGPGAVNIPISCGGLVVQPGDLILGDADGILAIPANELSGLMPKVQEHLEREAAIRETNAQEGGNADRINALLRSKGLNI
ncbi:RraA family protein [Acetobacter nitrogenifigens]|uniref:Putative 4-hydroxy-4-methyl-2-oxoglutarate aldolase n=1 Tax=Acetobacter nitrogenifigens DSM 23921 = NBRC 105050 TaxID=1120919 RepID=A0A511X6E2_9PROT|nr:RraA family protein [Acetobacter nitrogenifigens]GEN58501.1 dimethylmenaquinone methyltransferase [Acetobacter nitrogenifigens DSM 23921 = NBRC 105050]